MRQENCVALLLQHRCTYCILICCGMDCQGGAPDSLGTALHAAAASPFKHSSSSWEATESHDLYINPWSLIASVLEVAHHTEICYTFSIFCNITKHTQEAKTHTHTQEAGHSMCADPTSGVLSPDSSEKHSGCLERWYWACPSPVQQERVDSWVSAASLQWMSRSCQKGQALRSLFWLLPFYASAANDRKGVTQAQPGVAQLHSAKLQLFAWLVPTRLRESSSQRLHFLCLEALSRVPRSSGLNSFALVMCQVASQHWTWQ